MNKYLVKNIDDNTTAEYDSLFSAYSAVDYDAVFLNLKEYIELKFTSMETCDDFINTVSSLQAFSNIISAQVQTKYNIQDINQVFVLTTGSNNNATSKNIIVLEDSHFISRFNALLKDLGYNVVIEKNNEFIQESVKIYLLNHINEFLTIIEYLILENYTNIQFSRWQKSAVPETIDKHADYNSNDKYWAIINNEIHSANEYRVLSEFMENIDNIITLLISNKDNLKGILSCELIQLIF